MPQLSRQQQQILVHVYRMGQEADRTALPRGVVPWGVDGTRSFQASASRSLRRLERHGLLQRLHHMAARVSEVPEALCHRTTHVALTPDGLAIAQRLTTPGVVRW